MLRGVDGESINPQDDIIITPPQTEGKPLIRKQLLARYWVDMQRGVPGLWSCILDGIGGTLGPHPPPRDSTTSGINFKVTPSEWQAQQFILPLKIYIEQCMQAQVQRRLHSETDSGEWKCLCDIKGSRLTLFLVRKVAIQTSGGWLEVPGTI